MQCNDNNDQTLTYCGVYLENNWFSYGQLYIFYVAFSRVGRLDHLYIYASQNKTECGIPRCFDLSNIKIEQLCIESLINIHK